jgi:hypothetical protein
MLLSIAVTFGMWLQWRYVHNMMRQWLYTTVEIMAGCTPSTANRFRMFEHDAA